MRHRYFLMEISMVDRRAQGLHVRIPGARITWLDQEDNNAHHSFVECNSDPSCSSLFSRRREGRFIIPPRTFVRADHVTLAAFFTLLRELVCVPVRVLCMPCVCAHLSSLPPAALSPVPLSHCHFAVAVTLHCLKRFWWGWMGYYVRISRLETSRKVEIRRRIAYFLSSQSSLLSLLINGLTREVSRVYRCAKWILNKREFSLTLSVCINILSRSSTRNGD